VTELSPFDVIRDLQNSKKRLITGENEKAYAPWIVNRGMSLHIDTVLYANDVNMMHHVGALLQHDYYFHSIRSMKRWSKWHKKLKDDDIEAITEYCECSREKAAEIRRLLTDENLELLKKELKLRAAIKK
jgi:hypothetical protein